ncbi:hypothetical protein ERO13_D11G104301v2 [Gossypium hirsutum]|uniref:Uncharacterized protein n=1 Tax=Gossypium darwinii TaxID=34276 RepID=A0A5D2AIS1_GOSDA|nr:hypothetical protein ERO13_D11G104301v2 [Gossypium hirsutum]TYG44681.1 hypothetical protein ES288_D11G115200v1 [Gossypium darwinii]
MLTHFPRTLHHVWPILSLLVSLFTQPIHYNISWPCSPTSIFVAVRF